MADRDEDEDRPRKKRPLPSDDEDDDLPRKKRRPRDDEEEERMDVRRRKRRDADEDEGGDLGNNPLGAVVPLGVSVWALLSLYSSLLSCVVPGLGLLGILFGVIAFATAKHKATYGSISGNMRAVLGIVIGLGTVVIHIIALIAFVMNRR
jgi:hypothetical protein